MGEWQPIETAPYGKRVLLWWTPKNGNKYAELAITGTVMPPENLYEEGAKPTKYWDGGHAGPTVDAEGCKDLARITHWQPLPPPPQQEGKTE